MAESIMPVTPAHIGTALALAVFLALPALGLEKVVDPPALPREAAERSGGCQAAADTLCLNNERFGVQITWRDFQGQTGVGTVVKGGTDDSGLFWFFSSDNWEVLVKVLDGCDINQYYWVFASATTNVEYTLTVTDTQTQAVAQYTNPLGTAADALTDTAAFETCP
jgi:hypothetical protein